MGAAEVMASPVAAGPDREESLERTMGLAGPGFLSQWHRSARTGTPQGTPTERVVDGNET